MKLTNKKALLLAKKGFKKYGGRSEGSNPQIFLHASAFDFIEFIHTPPYKSREFLQAKYVEEGLSLGRLAEITASSKDIIRRALRRHGIPLRTETSAQRKAARPKFGHRMFRGKLVPMPDQQKAIQLVYSLRIKGLSTPEIARTLEELGILTMNGGKKWHPEMIRRILEKNSPQTKFK